METLPFASAASLPLSGDRVWLSFPPDQAGDMLRWLAKPEQMAHLAQHSKKLYVMMPSVVESIADELKAGTPEAAIATAVQQDMQAYRWYTERVDNPATPAELVQLVKVAQQQGVTLVALNVGASIHPETDKSLESERNYWGRADKPEPVSLRAAAATLFSPVRQVAEGVREDVRVQMLSDRANFNNERVMSQLEDEKGPFILISDAPKHNRTRPLSATYQKTYGQPLMRVDLVASEEVPSIDLSGLSGLGNVQPDRVASVRPKPSSAPAPRP